MSSALVDDESRVRGYDPLHHELIDRAQLRRLQPILEAGAHRIAGNLSSIIHRPLRVGVSEVEQDSWDAFLSTMGDSTFVATASIAGSNERIALHLPIATALSLIEVQLGGTGQTTTHRTSLTDLELSLAARLATSMVSALESALEPVLEVTTAAVQHHRNPHYVKMGNPGELCARIDMSIAMGDGHSRECALYLPATTLRSMIETIERLQGVVNVEEGVICHSVEQRLLRARVEVALAYPPVGIAATELLSLQVGEVIPLDRPEDDGGDLDIIVGRVRIGHGVIVRQEGKRCFCSVTEWERGPHA